MGKPVVRGPVDGNAFAVMGAAGLREFTKEDWYGMAGASRFADGREPMVAYGVPIDNSEGSWPMDGGDAAMVLIDGEGVAVEVNDNEGNFFGYRLSTVGMAWYTREIGEAIVQQITYPIRQAQLVTLGFERYSN